MENDYSQLEHLVQDVTSLDTARMTLRWALERLNVLERANRELDEKLVVSQESQKNAEKRMQEMEEMVASRSKLWSEQEVFYKKLEQTVNLLAEGKVDIVQIARKEADLDRVRQEISQQYKNQLEELERAGRDMAARWTERLLKAESFNPEAVSEVIQKYDDFRRKVDLEYQDRLLRLEQAADEREEKLRGRERELESAHQAKQQELERLKVELQAGMESRLRELEAAHGARRLEIEKEVEEKKSRLSTEVQALRESLHRDFQDRMQAWQKDRARREEELRMAVEAERGRSNQEVEDLSRNLQASARRITELEQILAASDVEHQEDVVRRIAEADANFQEKVKDLERIQADNRAAMEARTRRLEEEFAARRAELEKFSEARGVAQTEELGRERKLLDLQKKLVLDELARADERFKKSQEEIAALRSEAARQQADWDIRAREAAAALENEWCEKLAAADAKQQDRIRELENFWGREKERLLQDLAARDGALAKAHADLLAAGEKGARELQSQLETYRQEEAQKRAALAETWDKERGWFLKELVGRDASMEELRRQIETSEQLLTQSTVEAWRSLEALRASLHQEFQGVLKAGETVSTERLKAAEAQREQERRQLLAEIQSTAAQAEEKLRALESQWEESRRGLLETIGKMGAQGEARLKESQAQWQAENQRLSAQIQERESTLANLAKELQQAQDARIQDSEQAQRAAGELRSRLALEFEQALDARGKQEEDRRAALEAGWRAEKVRLLEEISRVEEHFKKAQDEILALRDAMDRQRQELEGERRQLKDFLETNHRRALEEASFKEDERRRGLESEWKAERERLSQETALKEQELQRAQMEREAWQAERLKMTEDAGQREALQTRMEESWRLERERLVREIETWQKTHETLTRELETARRDFIESRARAQMLLSQSAAEADIRAAKTREDLEADYRQKKDALLDACERYRRELDEREKFIDEKEKMIDGSEDNHEQGQ